VRDVLRELDFFQGLGESALQLMVSAAKEVSLAADADLFREGAAADALFIIRSGRCASPCSHPAGGYRSS